MALQSSGPISLANIAAEFGGAAPHSLSEYYRGGGLVPTNNGNVPASGAISFGNFYGATNRVQKSITIASNQSNYVLNTAKVSGYVAGATDLVVTINSGVYISSTTTGGYALDVDTSWAAGDTIRINNNGFIVGMGGAGGAGSGVQTSINFDAPGTAGASGGPALRAQRPVSVQNNGTVGGGGGGGGGGMGRKLIDSYSNVAGAWGGGGGGGGRSGQTTASGGAGGRGAAGVQPNGNNGGAGSVSAPGSGGLGGYNTNSSMRAGTGGTGGGWGAVGSAGGSSTSYTSSTGGPYAGGAAGAAVAGNGNITWLATGTRLGAIT